MPRTTLLPQTEIKDVERPFVREAKKLGCKCRKMNGTGQKDWPDQLVLCPGGGVILIEFKRPGGRKILVKKETRQTRFHKELEAIGHRVDVFDSWQAAIKHVKFIIGLGKATSGRY